MGAFYSQHLPPDMEVKLAPGLGGRCWESLEGEMSYC